MSTSLQDVRFAFRQFGSHPGFALTAVLSRNGNRDYRLCVQHGVRS